MKLYSLVSLISSVLGVIKISPQVKEDMKSKTNIRVLVQLNPPRPILAKLKSVPMPTDEHIVNLLSDLQNYADESQEPVLQVLDKLIKTKDVLDYTSYPLTNTLAVVGNPKSIKQLTALDDFIVEISSNRPFRIHSPEPFKNTDTFNPPNLSKLQWNLNYIYASSYATLAAKGLNETQMVYANADSGVDFKHEALVGNYAGKKGNSFDHNYSWWDAIKNDANLTSVDCPADSLVPCDDAGHGTHTMSIAVGPENLGVVPTSRWMTCRNVVGGMGTPEAYLGCLQFFLAPTNLKGTDPKPEKRPHVIGSSYSCSPNQGCSSLTFGTASDILEASGIFLAVPAGNDGEKGCGSITDSPAIDASSFVVGSTGFKTSARASFSSVGPVAGRYYGIDLVAPGVDILGAIPRNMYSLLEGTTTSSAHVGGAALAIMHNCPSYHRQVVRIKNVLRSSARELSSYMHCDNGPSAVPNNEFGYGMLDVRKALEACSKDL